MESHSSTYGAETWVGTLTALGIDSAAVDGLVEVGGAGAYDTRTIARAARIAQREVATRMRAGQLVGTADFRAAFWDALDI
jgi:hypothetical protein